MLFPSASLEDWLKRYPKLKVIAGRCNSCGSPMETVRPFITKGYAGLRAHDCTCGKNTNAAAVMITTTNEAFNSWNVAVGSYR